ADFHGDDAVGWAVAVDRWIQPRGSWAHFPRAGTAARLAREGIAGKFNVAFSRPGALFRVGLNNGWEIVQGVARQAGYSAKISDKGRLAAAAMRLAGDGDGL